MNPKRTAPVPGVNRRPLPVKSQTRRPPDSWRNRLPDPATYFQHRVERLGKPNGFGWAQGKCPFHDDHEASLSVNVVSPKGGWLCFAGCGKGDLVAFHMKLTGKSFPDAVSDLLGVRQ